MTSPSVERAPRWLLNPLNQPFTIHTRPIHHPRHRVRVQFQARASGEHIQNVLCLRERGIKPGIFQRSRQDDRHAVVKLGHRLVRVGRDDREGIEVVAVGALPHIIEASKRDILVILGVNIVWRFVPSLSLPLIIATSRYQGAVVAQQAPERGSFGQRLPSLIDHLISYLLVLGPMRNQALAHEHDPAGAIGNNHGHYLPGRDVMAGNKGIEYEARSDVGSV